MFPGKSQPIIGKPPPAALTIAGSDSGGGAGIQADLKTFSALGVYGTSALTAVTAQDTRSVREVSLLDPELVGAQIDAVMEDIEPGAVKTGMLGGAEIVRVVAEKSAQYRIRNLVVDPVMTATSGDSLLRDDAVENLQGLLLPVALVVTPNLDEAGILAGFPVSDRKSMRRAARAIHSLGPRYVVIKGGHRRRDADDLFFDGRELIFLPSPRLTGESLHGTGCTFSAAITAFLARGFPPRAAVASAKAFMLAALENPLRPGRGAAVADWAAGAGPAGSASGRSSSPGTKRSGSGHCER